MGEYFNVKRIIKTEMCNFKVIFQCSRLYSGMNGE